MTDGLVKDMVHDDYPKRARWEGDYGSLVYDVEGELEGGGRTTIHYKDENGDEQTAVGDFMEIASHNSWLQMAEDGNWYVVQPNGLVSVDLAGTGDPPETEYLGIAHKVVSWVKL